MPSPQDVEPSTDQPFIPPAAKSVFISYSMDAQPDATLAWKTYEALKDRCRVFIAQNLQPGTDWAKRIDEELPQADFFICFLSETSLNSSMVFGEVDKAHLLSEGSGGRPVIVPVRVAYMKREYPYRLHGYLSTISWVTWEQPEDTPRVIETLRQVVIPEVCSGAREEAVADVKANQRELPPLPMPVARLEMPGGTMRPESQYYVERTSDKIALRSIQWEGGVTLAIKGPRQVGKSTLLKRLINAAKEAKKDVVHIDFERIGDGPLQSLESLLKEICTYVALKLNLPDRVPEYWGLRLGDVLRCSLFMEEHILADRRTPLVLAMDDADVVFDTDFRSDFFGMLRSWHNGRADDETRWKNLDMILVTSAEPSQFITKAHRSPFNVAAVVEPEDFNEDQVADLIVRHGLPAQVGDLKLSQELMRLLDGHPYLTRVALYELAIGGSRTIEELVANAASDRGAFSEHLRYYLNLLRKNPELLPGLQEVIKYSRCSDDQVAYRLQAEGLVRIEDRTVVRTRCQLYSTFFHKYLYA